MGQWLFPSGNPNTTPPATRLRVQSSIQGMVRPIVWGQTRIAGNVIDYQDFRSFQTGSGSGGGKGGSAGAGGKGGSANTNYSVTAVVGLCEGPIVGILGEWASKNFFTPQQVANAGFTVFTGSTTQTAWSYMASAHPANALNYRNLAYVAVANFPLGSSPEVPSWNWEVLSAISYAYKGTNAPNTPPDIINGFYNGNYPPVLQGTTPILASAGLPDANPRDVIVDFLTNKDYGVNWPSNRIDTAMTQFSAQCLALGLVISPALIEATEAQAFLSSITDACIASFRWSNGILTVVPWFDQAITSGQITQLTQTGQVIPSPSQPPPTVQIALGTFVANVKVQASGGGAVYTQVSYNTFLSGLSSHTYAVSPAGMYYFSTSDSGSSVDITYTVAAQTSYQPFNTPIYDINLDLLPNQGTSGAISGDAPVLCVRTPHYYLYNSVKLEWLDRNNNYDPSVVEIKDQAAIEAFGAKARSQTTSHMFCIGAAATISGVLQLGRERIANLFTFTLGPQYILLEVEDLLTITRAEMGLAQYPVRITEIQENADGTLTITAEEYFGTVTAPLFGSQLPSGLINNYNQDPGSINQPIIFEAPAALAIAATGSPFVVGAFVSGVNTSVWGGCEVWASGDGNTYAHYGTIRTANRMGVLSANLSSSPTFAQTGQTLDTTSTLAVDLTESAGQLTSGSAIDLMQGNTLCWVANSTMVTNIGEVIGYETATLTAPHKYSLTTLSRGNFQQSSDMVSHPAGAAFARIDGTEFYTAFNPALIGQTVYFKFQSFNHWGGGLQNLAAVGAVAYTFSGNTQNVPLPQVGNLRAFFEGGFEKLYWDEVSDYIGRTGILYEIRKGSAFNSAVQIGLVAHPPFVIFGGNDTYWVSARWQTPQGPFVYSAQPSDVVIAGNTLVPFLFQSVNEQSFQGASWPGTISNSTVPTWNPILTNSTNIIFGPTFLAVSNPSTSSTRSDYAFVQTEGGGVAGTPNSPVYFEIVANSLGGQSSGNNPIGVGIASTAFQGAPSGFLGSDAGQASVGLFNTGTVYVGGSSQAVSAAVGFSTGDIVRVAFNSVTSSGPLVWFDINGSSKWNGSSLNSPTAGTGGVKVPGVSTASNFYPAPAVNLRLSTSAKITARFTSSDWSFPSPGSTFAQALVPSITRVGVAPNAVLVGAVGSTVCIYETNFLSIMDIGYIPSIGVSMNVNFLATGAPVTGAAGSSNFNVLAISDFLHQPDILGSSAASLVDVHPEIAIASTLSSSGVPVYKTVSTIVGSSIWQKFVPGVYNGQFFKTRVVMTSLSPYTVQPYCLADTWTSQIPLRIDHYALVSSTVANVTQNFRLDGDTSSNPVPFNSPPNASTVNPYFTYAIIGGQPGDVVTGAINLSNLQFSVLNGGLAVIRAVDFTIEGI